MATGDKPHGGRPDIPDLDIGAPRAPAKPSGAAWPAADVPAPKVSGAAWPAAGVPPPKISGTHPRAVEPRAPVEATADAASPNPQDYFGTANFDGDHFGGDDGFLSIDTSEPMDFPRGFSSFPPASGLGVAAPPAASSRSPAAAPPVSSGARHDDRRHWPTGVTPATETIQIERAELLELAAFGPVPSFALLAPLYSFRVAGRRRALRAAIRGLLEEFVGAERARDRLLADLARDFRAQMPEGSPAARLYAAVSDKEQRVREEQGALAGANSEYHRGIQAIDAEAAETQRALVEIRSTLAGRQAAFVDAENDKNRAEAKKKRLYIELSGIVAQAEKAGGKIPPEHAGTVARLESEIAAQKPDLERLERRYAETKAAFTAARNEERRLIDQGRESDRRRRALDAEFEQKIGVRNEGAHAAERATEAALADVGRALLAARTPMGELELNFFTALERGDGEVAVAARAVEKHVRALDVHDASTYKRGFVIAAVGVVAMVVLIIVAAR